MTKHFIKDISCEQGNDFIISNGLQPYDKCLCGSGKKFKFCSCFSAKPNLSGSEMKAIMGKMIGNIWSRKDIHTNCIIPACNQASINSHAIQKEHILQPLTDKNGKLRRYICLYKDGTTIPHLQEISLDKATAFWGFCSSHDNAIFETIEKFNPLCFDEQRNYAHVFRVVAYYYTYLLRHQQAQKEIFQKCPQFFKNIPISKVNNDRFVEQFFFISNMVVLKKRLWFAENYLSTLQDCYNPATKVWDTSSKFLLFSKIFYVDVPKASFTFFDTVAYHDKRNAAHQELAFQSIDDEHNNHLTILCIPLFSEEKQMLFFAARTDANQYIKNFIDRVNTFSNDEIVNIASNMIIDNLENFYFSDNYSKCFLSPGDHQKLAEQVKGVGYQFSKQLLLDDLISQSPVNFFFR